MIADTPHIKNLDSPEFMKSPLNGKVNLPNASRKYLQMKAG